MAPFLFWRPRRARIYRRRTIITEKKPGMEFRDGDSIEVQGRRFGVQILESAAGYSSAKLREGKIVIKLAQGMDARKRKEHITNLGRRVLTRELLPVVEKRVRELNDLHFKSQINKVRLKDTSTLWGSCSALNNINLDFRLLFAPPHILDAIIVHELAHTVRRDHSREYWSLVMNVIPDYKERRRWLRANSMQLKPVITTQVESTPIPQNI